MCILFSLPRVIDQFKYDYGNPRRLIVYFFCNIVLNRSIVSTSDEATINSSNVTAVIVYDPSSSNLKKYMGRGRTLCIHCPESFLLILLDILGSHD